MSDQFKKPFTAYIMADVSHGKLDAQRIARMREDLAQEPAVDREYIDSLDEALSILLGPEEIVKRMTARQGTEGEVEP